MKATACTAIHASCATRHPGCQGVALNAVDGQRHTTYQQRHLDRAELHQPHLVKSGEGMPFLRQGTRPGHIFQVLSNDQGPTKAFDAFMVTISEPSENLPTVEHPGTKLIHMLEGVMEYRGGQTLYMLEPGGTLTLQGEVLHGFERLIKLPIRFLSTIVYTGATS